MPSLMFGMLQKLWNKLPKVWFILVFPFIKFCFGDLAYQLLLLLLRQEVSRKVGLLRFTLFLCYTNHSHVNNQIQSWSDISTPYGSKIKCILWVGGKSSLPNAAAIDSGFPPNKVIIQKYLSKWLFSNWTWKFCLICCLSKLPVIFPLRESCIPTAQTLSPLMSCP